MELQEAIRKRRSIRSFSSEVDVTDEDIRKIIEAGIWAPSSGNTQCWQFLVTRNDKIKAGLAKAAFGQDFIKEAPVVIVVSADLRCSKKYGKRGVETYALQDTAAAIQNMLLTITELGLGSCWVGAFDEVGVREVLNLSEDIRPLAILPIGQPKESPKAPKRREFAEVTRWI